MREYTKRLRLTQEADKENNEYDSIDLSYIENKIVFMKNKFVNCESDKNEIEIAMQETRKYRNNWLKEKSPSISEIIEKFPKFLEMPFLVRFFY